MSQRVTMNYAISRGSLGSSSQQVFSKPIAERALGVQNGRSPSAPGAPEIMLRTSQETAAVCRTPRERHTQFA